jgi:hypothetical protein
MSPHLSIIKLLLRSEVSKKYEHKLSVKDFPEELQFFYNVVNSFHKNSDEPVDLSVADLAGLVYDTHPKKQEINEAVLDTLAALDVNEAIVDEVVKKMRHGNVLREISLAAYEAAEGKTNSEKLLGLFGELENQEHPPEEEAADFVEEGLSDLIEQTYNQPGLRWRLAWLNKTLGSLRKGDFGFVFARPETGKTTFLASEISYMAEQLGENDGPIIWFNNEEQSKKVKVRVYQSSLGKQLFELSNNVEGNDQEYLAKTKNKIKISNNKVISKSYIEHVCRKYKPSLIIFDQIDKIQGFKADRKDLELGAIYIWARDLAKQFCPVIGICQADGTGENVRYLTMGHVADAKTSKQAEADWILGIGCIHDTGWENVRFLNISKNKLQGDVDTDPTQRHGKTEVLIQPEIARYKDL